MNFTNESDYIQVLDVKDVLKLSWLSGIVLSLLGFGVQLIIIVFDRNLRKFDEITLCELTVSRTINTICEFNIMYYVPTYAEALKALIFAFYFHSDVVLVIFMFVFTRNIYSKIVVVFPVHKYNILLTSLCIWTLPLPISILFPIFLRMDNNYFDMYYKVYAHVKFTTLAINMLMFAKIVSVVLNSTFNRDRNWKEYIKTAAIVFLLVTITSIQVLLTDLLSFYYDAIKSDMLVLVFCILNSFQVIPIMSFFVIVVTNKIKQSKVQNVTMKLSDIVSV